MFCGLIVSASLGTSVSESEDKLIMDDSDSELRSIVGTSNLGSDFSKIWGLQAFLPSFLEGDFCPYTSLNVRDVARTGSGVALSSVLFATILSARSKSYSKRSENSS